MKERPIFESKEPNKNLVELNDADKKVVTKALKDLIQSAGFLLDHGGCGVHAGHQKGRRHRRPDHPLLYVHNRFRGGHRPAVR